MYNQYYNKLCQPPKSGHWTKYIPKGTFIIIQTIRIEIQISSADFRCIFT